ncbi:hypothetical protein Vadar_027892 [Vaccinium darrowii]|uniref:Uncharacterized protein n=1 Tax=Vaccinium darrowii TaxID=229202 RepID=A0ACB7ZLU3_9ERIC|nr:hypothetical protein Vadar_027892 [Vaccinium darrowii]
MATAVSTFGAANRGLFNLNGSSAATAVPTASFFSNGLKKAYTSKFTSQRKFRVVAEVDEKKQTDKDRRICPVYDVSDNQQDITRGKGMVDSFSSTHLFQNTVRDNELLRLHQRRSLPVCCRTKENSDEIYGYNLDNNMDGFYVAPAFMDKLVVHITENFLTLPNIKVPLMILSWVFGEAKVRGNHSSVSLCLPKWESIPDTSNEEERLKPQPDNIIKSLHDLKDFEKEKTSEKFKFAVISFGVACSAPSSSTGVLPTSLSTLTSPFSF